MQQLAGAVRALWYAMFLIAFGLCAPICLAQAQGTSTQGHSVFQFNTNEG
jgi:hypothetical protein